MSTNIKQNIKTAIWQFSQGNLTENALHLFQTLGYDTDRQSPFAEKTFKSFKESYLDGQSVFREEKALVSDWKYVDLLFQLSGEEIEFDATKQDALIKKEVKTKGDSKPVIESYLFFAIELSKEQYTRTALSQITREVNKVFPMPVMILFKHGKTLSIAVIDRRLNMRDERKDVLKKVTLIKDISIENPHRAHIEILFDLSFQELLRVHKFTNFVELHNAWQKTLDTKEINRQFYFKLFNWYLWALKNVKFPQIRPDEDLIKDNIHQSESLIRLLTRLLFCWFMKEKGLINEDLFNTEKLKEILKGFKGHDSDETIYYKAILQNLFFATLNKPITERKLIKNIFPNPAYGDPLVYRYTELFKKEKDILKHFENIPFLNGGLFDCLDNRKDKDNPVEIRLDGFSSKKSKQPIVPDKLFFGEYPNIDLSDEYDDSKKSKVTVYGLIDILNHYKFTIEENTPIEEEIALDPELLGKVFENLLASYNPETSTTARKSTGSYYTPREIVDYMVTESLKAYLKQKLTENKAMKPEDADVALDFLFEYSEKEHLFDKKQVEVLISAIDSCKVIDPACGSGAFPMGVLQKLIHILRKIDPDNNQWFEIVISKFPAYAQNEMRKKLEHENWDYVRKLGIIQECIYGIDIQPIAIQIAKLRFFITLLVDQNEKPGAINRGFEALPNLDFKLVTANTLIGAPETDAVTTGLFATQTDPFFDKFDKLTEQYFSAYAPEAKKKLKEKITTLIITKCDEKIKTIKNLSSHRDERFIKVLAEKNKNEIKRKEREVKLWNSYNNLFKYEAVGFFEPKYFFPKAAGGFDVVIGNPPYIKEDVNKEAFDGLRNSECYQGKMDIWYLFGSKALDFLKTNGALCFIATANWITNDGASKFRDKIIKNGKIKTFVDFGGLKIFSAGIQTMVFVVLKNSKPSEFPIHYKKYLGDEKDADLIGFLYAPPTDAKAYNAVAFDFLFNRSEYAGKYITFHPPIMNGVLLKIKDNGNFHFNESEVYSGIDVGQDFVVKSHLSKLPKHVRVGDGVFVLTNKERESVKWNHKEKEILKPYYTAAEIARYTANKKNENWIIYSRASINTEIDEYPNIKSHLNKYRSIITSANAPYGLHRTRDENIFLGERIFSLRKCSRPSFALVNFPAYVARSFLIIKTDRINLKYAIAILNTKLIFFWLLFKGKLQGHQLQVDKEPILDMPIKPVGQNQEAGVVDLVNRILIAKANNSEANTSQLENEIDRVVYKIYGLTPEEIEIVEEVIRKV